MSDVPRLNVPSPLGPLSPSHIRACPAFLSGFPIKFGVENAEAERRSARIFSAPHNSGRPHGLSVKTAFP